MTVFGGMWFIADEPVWSSWDSVRLFSDGTEVVKGGGGGGRRLPRSATCDCVGGNGGRRLDGDGCCAGVGAEGEGALPVTCFGCVIMDGDGV